MFFLKSKHVQWSTLDNAAKIFPALISREYTSFFRLEAILNQPIVAESLLKALTLTLARYPTFQVKIRKGLFWYFFEEHEYPAKLLSLNDYHPCRYSNWKGHKQEPFWRVLVQGNRIATEFSHLITDGMGGKEFLSTLLCVYYELEHDTIQDWKGVLRLDDPHKEEEQEYSYRKYFSKLSIVKVKLKSSFHYPERRDKTHRLMRLHVSVSTARAIVKSYGISITDLFVSVHLLAVQNLYGKFLRKNKGLVRQLILVNLRRFFPSKTLRNFYLNVMPSIDFSLGKYTFAEIAEKIHSQTRYLLDPKELQRHFSGHVAGETEMVSRLIPRTIKNIVLAILLKIYGDRIILSKISNLGKVDFPKEIDALVESLALVPVPSRTIGKSFGIISNKDCLTITSGSFIASTKLEQEMAKILQSLGFEVSFIEW